MIIPIKRYRIEMTVRLLEEHGYSPIGELETSLIIPEKGLTKLTGEHLASMAQIMEPSFIELALEHVAELCAERLKVEEPVADKQPAF